MSRYEREALRCAKRRQRYVAPAPEGVNEERYDATCDETTALMRYGGGLPWRRQAGLQAMGGMPLWEATMWERFQMGDALAANTSVEKGDLRHSQPAV